MLADIPRKYPVVGSNDVGSKNTGIGAQSRHGFQRILAIIEDQGCGGVFPDHISQNGEVLPDSGSERDRFRDYERQRGQHQNEATRQQKNGHQLATYGKIAEHPDKLFSKHSYSMTSFASLRSCELILSPERSAAARLILKRMRSSSLIRCIIPPV